MPHPVAFDLGLHFLHMSHKKDARLIWVKNKKKKCDISDFSMGPVKQKKICLPADNSHEISCLICYF